MKFIKVVLILLVSASIVSCTNSKWFLSTVYNRVDNMLYSEVMDYADFDRRQQKKIRLLVNQFHHWHRTTQLPQYALFLKSLREKAYSDDSVSLEEVENWSRQIKKFIYDAGACHPLMFSSDIMVGLTDEQVEEIAQHSRDEYEEYLERYQKEKPEKRFEERYRSILKWFGRFQLSINDNERQLLRDVMDREPKLRQASFGLWARWDQTFYQLLLERNESNFPERVRAHVLSLNTMMEDSYPDEVELKLGLWVDFFHRIAQSELDENEQGFPKWADKMAFNLDAISESVPEKQQGWDAQDYCDR